MRALKDEDFARETARLKTEVQNGKSLDDVLYEAFALTREASRRVLGQRHYDVQLIGGMFLHQGCIAEMRTGEGKTLTATLPYVPQRALGPRRARGHRQRLPGQPRRGVDGPGLQVPGHDHGLHPPRPVRQAAPGGVPLGHHLRAEQRVRLRLPARQHEVPPAGLRAARAQLRHRRRDRLDPHRRGAHPAHHLRPHRGQHRAVRHGRPGHLRPGARAGLPARREGALGDAHRRGHREAAAAPQDHQPLRPRAARDAAPRRAGPARAHPLQARPRLRGEGRRGADRRRAHRPHHAGPPLERRPAPGHRGQGRRQHREREPDARHRLVPELLPHVHASSRA